MKANKLQPNVKRKKSKRVGRGYASGKGSTSGRGTKGELSRAGHRIPKGFEGGQTRLMRRIPKRRGFNNKWKKVYFALSIDKLSIFSDGDKISLESLWEKGLVSRKIKLVKIVGGKALEKKLVIVNLPATKSAKSMIEKAGGQFL